MHGDSQKAGIASRWHLSLTFIDRDPLYIHMHSKDHRHALQELHSPMTFEDLHLAGKGGISEH